MKCSKCGTENAEEFKFCSMCGTPLTDPEQPRPNNDSYVPIALQTRTTPFSFDQELQRLTSQGWQILNRTDVSAQLKKSKEWSKVGLVLFVLVPLLGGCVYFPLFAIALIGLLFVVLDYLLRKERLLYVTAEQLSQGEIPLAQQGSTWTQPLIVGGILILIFAICLGGFVFLMNIVSR